MILNQNKLNQYALANSTRLLETFPEKTHLPDSSIKSNGMQRIVAFVSFLIACSVSSVPSQCADMKPPFLSNTFLKSSKLSTEVIFCSRKLFEQYDFFEMSFFDLQAFDLQLSDFLIYYFAFFE